MNTLSWIVDDSLSIRLTVALLHFLWQGCCVGLVVMICGALLRGATARLRYSLNVATMLMMAACLPATFFLVDSPDAISNRNAASQPVNDTHAPHLPSVENPTHLMEQGIPVASEVMGTREPSVERIPTSETGGMPTETGTSRGSPAEWVRSFSSLSVNAFPALSRWIAPLYLTGVAFILGRLVCGVWGGQRLRRMAIAIEDDALLASFQKLAYRVGLKVMPTVAWCEQISIPVVVGIVRPMILLPMAVVSNLTPDQLQALMLHELSHIRRYDPFVNLLQRIVEAVLFFHPVVWFVSRRISVEREHAADDMVLAAGLDRPQYADALVRVAELAAAFTGRSAAERATILAAAGANPSEFKLRILRLLDASPPKLALSRTGILLVLSFILVGGAFAWSQTYQREATRDSVDAAGADPTPPPGQQPIPKDVEPREGNTVPPKGLEFLQGYPALHALSLDMTEPQFLDIVKQQKLTTTKSGEGDKIQHHLALGDGHTLIVMFNKGGDKCSGIQRVRGDDNAVALQTMRKPALLLPDHWIVRSVGFDNDGKELVTSSTQSFVTIRRWDLVGKQLISEIKLAADKHGRAFHEGTLTLSGDRRRIIAATDAYVGIWDTATGKLLSKLPIPKVGDNDTVRLLTCTPDFSVIVGSLETNYDRTTLVYDAHTVVWDGTSGKMLRTNTHKDQTRLIAISLSSDGTRLATTNGGGASIWDTKSGEHLLAVANDNAGRKHSDPKTSSLYTNHVWSLQFSPSGKQLAIGDILGVKLVNATSGKLLQQLEGPYRYSSGQGRSNLVFSQDGQLLARLGTGDKAAGARTGYVVPIWSTQTGHKRFELHTDANGGAFSEDGQRFAVGFSDMQQALSVWPLSGKAADPERPDGPGPESRQDKVEENGHYQGKKAAEFIDKFQPTWGDPTIGIQYGIALTKPQRQYRSGERVPLVVFFRNASDQLLKIDMRPDFLGNTPKVINAEEAAVEFENVPLLGHIPHYVENLEPGEAVGPFYLNLGLGENPRPGKQNWHPYYRAAVAGKYQLMHTVAMDITGVKDGDQAKRAEVTSGTIAFEIVDGGKPAAQGPADKPGAAVVGDPATGAKDEPVAPGDPPKAEAAPLKERPNYVKVIGQLLDADTGKPIEKASWECGMASLEKPGEVAWGHSKSWGGSYPNGHFEQLVHFTPDGRFDRLRVYSAGYETTVIVNDLPNPRPLQVERIVRLKRGQTVTGTLRDHTGKPVANGWVFFIPAGHRSNIVEGAPGTDAHSLPDAPRDGAVAEARTNTQGQFVLSAGSAGTLAASTDAVDLWPFELPDDGQADLTMPEPAHLEIDLTYWYLDVLAKKGKRAVSPNSEDPNQCWIQVDRAGDSKGLWKRLEYRRQMFVFTLDPRAKLSKGVSIGQVIEGELDKPILGVGHNKSTATKIRIALPPGSYRVQRLKSGPFAPVDEQNVELKSGADTVVHWSRSDGAAVLGKVTWPANMMFVRQPGEAPRKLDWTVPDLATVTIANAEGKPIEAAKIQADGRFFVATHLEPGKYQATATVYLSENDFRGGYRGPDCVATQQFVIAEPLRGPSGSPPENVELTIEADGPRFVPGPVNPADR